jgi:hypothetical protein
MLSRNMTEPAGELILDRFCGREIHPVLRARWNLYRDEQLDRTTLCIQVIAGPGSTLSEDTAPLVAEPTWEINVVSATLTASSLREGLQLSVPIGYDEEHGGYVTNFYYCSHEQTDNNVVEIVRIEGSRLRVRLSGDTIDVNYYDGSKPATHLSTEVWCERDSRTTRSMS